MDAQASTFVDGMRDIAAGTREVFNLESVEVIKGADSAYAGRGGAGGSINLVTKKARNENFISGDVGLGTDSYRRATIDANRVLGEGVGLRLNAMVHDADVPGRSGPENKRWGIAPTVTFGMGTPTEVSLSWQHLQTDNIPDGGVPYLYTSTAAAGLPGGSVVRPTYGSNRDNWYGLTSRDYEKEKSDLFTATVEHKFTDTNKFRNSLRYSKTEQDYLWTQPDDSKGNVVNGYVFRRGNARVADIKTLQNLSEFTGKAQTGSVGHSYAFGLELSKEKAESRTAALQTTNTTCTAASLWCASLNNPDSSPLWNLPVTLGDPSHNKIDTVALYGFDTLKFNDRWLLNAGLRLDHYKLSASGPAGRNTPAYDLSRSDTLFNYQLGLVYKPATNGSIYASLGTSSRPGGSMLGNGNEDLGISTDQLANLAPEKTRSLELGTVGPDGKAPGADRRAVPQRRDQCAHHRKRRHLHGRQQGGQRRGAGLHGQRAAGPERLRRLHLHGQRAEERRRRQRGQRPALPQHAQAQLQPVDQLQAHGQADRGPGHLCPEQREPELHPLHRGWRHRHQGRQRLCALRRHGGLPDRPQPDRAAEPVQPGRQGLLQRRAFAPLRDHGRRPLGRGLAQVDVLIC